MSVPFARRAWLVRTTLDDEAKARELARRLVGPDLAACVHVAPVRSAYAWKGQREEAREWLVEARVPTRRRRRRVAAAMLEGHPYELPLLESVAIRVGKRYWAWMESGD